MGVSLISSTMSCRSESPTGRRSRSSWVGNGGCARCAVLVRPSLVRGVRVREMGEHAQRLVHERVAGGLRAVVPGPVDSRGRGDAVVDVIFGARGRQRTLEPGEQAAALAFGLRVDAAFRRCRADDRARLEVAEPTARVHAFGPLGDGHAHRDTRVCRPFDLQPSLNPLGRPSSPERVHDPGERRRVRHARGPARPSGPLFGLPPRGHGRMERPRRPRVRLRAARPSGTIRVVLVGRGPQAAFQLATDGRLVTADPWSYLTHTKPLPVPQFVDPDTFLCQHVGIRFHIERDTFSGHEPEHFQP